MQQESYAELQAVIALVQSRFPDGEQVTAATSFSADLGLDSLQLIELLNAIEQSFELELPFDRLFEIDSIADAARLLAEEGVFLQGF